MEDFTLFTYRDKNDKSIIQKIANTPLADLRRWMGPSISKFEIAIIWAILNDETDSREFSDFYRFKSDDFLEKEKALFIKKYNSLVKKEKIAEKNSLKFLK